MNKDLRLAQLQTYRRERENHNADPSGEATGRIYLLVPEALKEAGQTTQGVAGFINLFKLLLENSPVIIRRVNYWSATITS